MRRVGEFSAELETLHVGLLGFRPQLNFLLLEAIEILVETVLLIVLDDIDILTISPLIMLRRSLLVLIIEIR